MNATKLNYSSKFINRNYLLKVSGVDNNGNRIHKLVGVSGLLELIGAELMNKFIARAERDGFDYTVCKLRRGLKVTLYAK